MGQLVKQALIDEHAGVRPLRKYSEDQPRDEIGRWTDGDGAGSENVGAKIPRGTGGLDFKPMSGGISGPHGRYSISPARYSSGKVAVQAPSEDSWKTRAARLAEHFSGGRYSNREKAYIMSPAAAERFVSHYHAGKDASLFTGSIKD
jgi:hypothetical protein